MKEMIPVRKQTLTVSGLNLQPLIDSFCEAQDVRQDSRDTYGRGLKQFFLWLQAQGITNPNRETILQFKDYLTSKDLSPSTISAYLTTTRKFFEWTSSKGLYMNIAEGVKGAKKPRGFRRDSLTVSQVKELLTSLETDTLQGKRDYAMLNLMVRTGLRSIEVIRADVQDIRQDSGEAVLWIQGKGRDSKDEFVLLTEETLKPIQAYLSVRGTKDNEPLFTSNSDRNHNGRLTTRTVRRIVKDKLKGIGLISGRLSCHSLRHSAITLSLQAGATIQEAQALGRHSNVNTTLIYAHNINRVMNAPEKKIDELLRAN